MQTIWAEFKISEWMRPIELTIEKSSYEKSIIHV